MSADNGIYILRTTNKDQPHEYRVAHLQAVENYQWDDEKKDYTSDPDVQIKNASEMWAGCQVLFNRTAALEWADKTMREVGYTEYGIQFIEIDRPFRK